MNDADKLAFQTSNTQFEGVFNGKSADFLPPEVENQTRLYY